MFVTIRPTKVARTRIARATESRLGTCQIQEKRSPETAARTKTVNSNSRTLCSKWLWLQEYYLCHLGGIDNPAMNYQVLDSEPSEFLERDEETIAASSIQRLFGGVSQSLLRLFRTLIVG